MRRALQTQTRDCRGFSLIELLIIILIIGILATIALPAFLRQRSKGQDATAKSDARNLVTSAESCYVTNGDYSACPNVVADAGLGSSGNANTFTPNGQDGYVIQSVSRTNNVFLITKPASGPVVRKCDTAGGTTYGGCEGTSW